jgi:clostripain
MGACVGAAASDPLPELGRVEPARPGLLEEKNMIALLAAAWMAMPPSAVETDRAWTFLIYGAADNDADGHMFEFIRDVRAALAGHKGVEVVLFMDRHQAHSDEAETLGEDFTGARIYRLTGGGAERLSGGEVFPEIRLDTEWEADSGDPATLDKFLRFGKTSFPARHHALLIYSHADGVTMCPDEGNQTEMSLAEFPRKVGADCAVDWTGLELCNMGGFESAYSWRPGSGGFSTEYLVAIPNAGPPLDWARILAGFKPEMTPRELGLLAIEEGGAGRLAFAQEHPGMADLSSHESVACYDTKLLEQAKRAWDQLAAALAQDQAARKVMGELRGPGPRGTVMNYSDGRFQGEHAFVDAVDLARRAADAKELSEPARTAAAEARDALAEAVIASFGMSGYEGFVPGENGITIAFPEGNARTGFFGNSEIVWSKYPWYATCAFGRDGAKSGDGAVTNWFELLDQWFDEGAGGGVNGVSP